VRAAPAVGDHQAALAEDAVGRTDRRRAGLEPGGQVPHGRQRVAGVEGAVADGGLGTRGDLAGGGAGDLIVILCCLSDGYVL
jgi:hypothetical protein